MLTVSSIDWFSASQWHSFNNCAKGRLHLHVVLLALCSINNGDSKKIRSCLHLLSDIFLFHFRFSLDFFLVSFISMALSNRSSNFYIPNLGKFPKVISNSSQRLVYLKLQNVANWVFCLKYEALFTSTLRASCSNPYALTWHFRMTEIMPTLNFKRNYQ